MNLNQSDIGVLETINFSNGGELGFGYDSLGAVGIDMMNSFRIPMIDS